jgi:hypothetical protein
VLYCPFSDATAFWRAEGEEFARAFEAEKPIVESPEAVREEDDCGA